MQKKTKILTLILTLVTAFSVFALSISADYTKVPQTDQTYGMQYAIGTSSNLFLVTGKDNSSAYSDTFGGGGQFNGVYSPSDVGTLSTYPYYRAYRNDTKVSLTHQYDDIKFGRTFTLYGIFADESLQELQHHFNFTLEGRYVDIFRPPNPDAPVQALPYLFPSIRYHGVFNDFSNTNDLTVYTVINVRIDFITVNNQHVYGTSSAMYTKTGTTVYLENDMHEAIASAYSSAIDKANRLESGNSDTTNVPADNQRAKVSVAINSYCKAFGRPQAEGFYTDEQLQVVVQYPVCNNKSARPNTDNVPFVNVTNKIDDDFSLTEWLGASARGIWRVELIPHVTVGGIVSAILGLTITLAFLKFFAGG